MHIDFHLYGTYLAARIAGFADTESRSIACAAQAVDDFILGEYSSVREAFDTISLENKDIIQTTWTLFHFLPAIARHKKLTSDEKESVQGMEFFATGPNSFLSNRMINSLEKLFNGTSEIVEKQVNRQKKLAAAGVAMHVLADTYAHEGYSGLCSPYNIIENVKIETSEGEKSLGVVSTVLRHVPVWMAIKSYRLDIGHGTAGHIPDISWAKYLYMQHISKVNKIRDNTTVFASAFINMVKVLAKLRNNTIDIDRIENGLKKSLIKYASNKKIEFNDYDNAISEDEDNFFANSMDRANKGSDIISNCCTANELKNTYNLYLEKIKKISYLEEDFISDIAEKEKLKKKNKDTEQEIEEISTLIHEEWNALSADSFFFATLWHRCNILPFIWEYAPDYPIFSENE